MQDQPCHIAGLWRRAMMMLGIGKITATPSDEGVVQLVQYQTDLEVRGSTPRLAEFGFSSGLPVGADVVIASLGGDRANPVIIASNHQGSRYTGLNAGEAVVYNQWGMSVKLTETGVEIEAKNQPVTVNDATTVTITATESVTLATPNLYVTGDIIDNSESNSSTLKQLRQAYNEHDHLVSGVASGSDSVTSATPEETV